MGQQQSQKSGLRSSGQKETVARDPYASIPPSNAPGGAFGEHKRETTSDEDLSLSIDERQMKRKRDEERKSE